MTNYTVAGHLASMVSLIKQGINHIKCGNKMQRQEQIKLVFWPDMVKSTASLSYLRYRNCKAFSNKHNKFDKHPKGCHQ